MDRVIVEIEENRSIIIWVKIGVWKVVWKVWTTIRLGALNPIYRRLSQSNFAVCVGRVLSNDRNCSIAGLASLIRSTGWFSGCLCWCSILWEQNRQAPARSWGWFLYWCYLNLSHSTEFPQHIRLSVQSYWKFNMTVFFFNLEMSTHKLLKIFQSVESPSCSLLDSVSRCHFRVVIMDCILHCVFNSQICTHRTLSFLTRTMIACFEWTSFCTLRSHKVINWLHHSTTRACIVSIRNVTCIYK